MKGLAVLTLCLLTPLGAQDLRLKVTIYRDTYGIPHVFGETDAATMFGFAYAQAEDNFSSIERNYIRAIGRRTEFEGERGLASDTRNRALEIARLAQAEYRRCRRSCARCSTDLRRGSSRASSRGMRSRSFATTTIKTDSSTAPAFARAAQEPDVRRNSRRSIIGPPSAA